MSLFSSGIEYSEYFLFLKNRDARSKRIYTSAESKVKYHEAGNSSQIERDSFYTGRRDKHETRKSMIQFYLRGDETQLSTSSCIHNFTLDDKCLHRLNDKLWEEIEDL